MNNYRIFLTHFNNDQIGSIGVVVGGIVSDKIVAKMGIKSRVAVLAISQLIASPGAFGSVYFDPLWAMITLGLSYFFGKFQTYNIYVNMTYSLFSASNEPNTIKKIQLNFYSRNVVWHCFCCSG